MEDKKYELTDSTIEYDEKTLYQIKALKDFADVKAGDLGGYIEKEDNLSHEGNCWIFDNAKVYENAKVYGNAKIYENATVGGEAKVFGNVKVYDKAKIYDKAEIFTDIEIGGETEVKGNEKLFNHSQYIDNLAKVYGNITTDEKTKTYDFSHKKDYSSNLENEIQKYEEHCSKVVDKLKLQDELPNFQVISQKGLLYEKNSEENNVSEMKNFIENLKGEEYWDNMNLKDIREWEDLQYDGVVNIVYESKDEKGKTELEEFTDYNDYAKETVKKALLKEFTNNPDSIETLRKDILDKEANKETLKENYEEIENKKEKTILESNKSFGFSNGF